MASRNPLSCQLGGKFNYPNSAQIIEAKIDRACSLGQTQRGRLSQMLCRPAGLARAQTVSGLRSMMPPSRPLSCRFTWLNNYLPFPAGHGRSLGRRGAQLDLGAPIISMARPSLKHKHRRLYLCLCIVRPLAIRATQTH